MAQSLSSTDGRGPSQGVAGSRLAAPDLHLVHPELGRGLAQLIEPTSHGFLYVAACVEPSASPLVRRSVRRTRLIQRAKRLVDDIAVLPRVCRASVFRAIVRPPTARFSTYLRQAEKVVSVADFDTLILIETESVENAEALLRTPECARLLDALESEAGHVRLMVARNVKRIADVEISNDGLFLFNHFAADDPELLSSLWDYLAGWYVAETGLRNSVALAAAPNETADYALVNWARWDTNPWHHFWTQLSKRSFWRYVVDNLEAHRAVAMPIYCRLA
jgi:hypothetical protein